MQLAIAVEAPNKKVAESIMTGKLWESYPANGDNYFKPKLWEHIEGQPLPAVGQFDEQFAQKNTFDGEKWVANSEDDGATELPAGDEVIDLMTVSPRERFAAVLLFSKLEINGQLYSQVVDYLDDLDNHDESLEEDDRFNFNVLCALHNNEPVKHMHVEGLNNLIHGIFSHFENQMPGKAAISQFVKRGLKIQVNAKKWYQAKIIPPALITTLKSRQSVVINIPMQHWIRRSLLRCSLSLPTRQYYQATFATRRKSLQTIVRILNVGLHHCMSHRTYSNMTVPAFSE